MSGSGIALGGSSEKGILWLVSLVGAFLLGAVLVIATVGKLADPIVFVEQIRTEGLDFLLSASLVAIIALALETGLGVALLLGVRHWSVLVSSAGLVAFFLSLTGWNYYLVASGQRENSYDCGCFGVFLQRTATEAFWQDLFLLVPPLLMAFLYRKALLQRVSAWKYWVSGIVTAGVVVYSAFVFNLPGIDPALEQETQVNGVHFRTSDQFVLSVDGVLDPEAMIYESEATLQFMVVSRRFDRPLLLDARDSRVRQTGEEVAGLVVGTEFTLPTDFPVQEVGEFSVGPEGLSFEFDGLQFLMRNRG